MLLLQFMFALLHGYSLCVSSEGRLAADMLITMSPILSPQYISTPHIIYK